MKVIIVKNAAEGGKKAFEIFKEKLDEGATVLAWQLAARLKRLIRNYAIATSIFRLHFNKP